MRQVPPALLALPVACMMLLTGCSQPNPERTLKSNELATIEQPFDPSQEWANATLLQLKEEPRTSLCADGLGAGWKVWQEGEEDELLEHAQPVCANVSLADSGNALSSQAGAAWVAAKAELVRTIPVAKPGPEWGQEPTPPSSATVILSVTDAEVPAIKLWKEQWRITSGAVHGGTYLDCVQKLALLAEGLSDREKDRLIGSCRSQAMNGLRSRSWAQTHDPEWKK